MTNLLTNTKTIFTSVTLYLFDKEKNKLSIFIIIGLIMGTLGAIFINTESLFYNLTLKKGKTKTNKEPEDNKNDEAELIEIEDKEKGENNNEK